MASASLASDSDKIIHAAAQDPSCATSCAREPDPAAADKALAGLAQDEIDALKKRLSPVQWTVTMENGTEPPFRNEYWDNHRPGLYLCIISGEPLFSSTDKFDSGTGWPSFTRPVAGDVVSEHTDRSHGMVRVEVRSVRGRSHLGHVFPDGPAPSRLRYCINSAALRFVPLEDLEKENLGRFRAMFETAKR